MSRRWTSHVADTEWIIAKFGVRPEPCPFCGSHLIGIYLSFNPHITCGECGADGPCADWHERPRDNDELQRRALHAWNRRRSCQ